ncbi:MAG: hypothetical protein KL785_08600 [Brevundimonas sp.]|nr:hypothetical protein [Brevundimonas sp.]
MPSPVPDQILVLIAAVTTVLGAAPVEAQDQSLPAAPPPGNPSYRITAHAETGGDRMEIVMEPAAASWTAAAWVWRGDTVWRTRDSDCPALRAALEELADLPPVQPAPWPLQPRRPPDAIAPGWLGPMWGIRTVAVMPDWSTFEVEIQGATGVYSRWAHQTASAVRGCDGAAS